MYAWCLVHGLISGRFRVSVMSDSEAQFDDREYAKALEEELKSLQVDLSKARNERESNRKSLAQVKQEKLNLELQYAQRQHLNDLNDEMMSLSKQLQEKESLKLLALQDLSQREQLEALQNSCASFDSTGHVSAMPRSPQSKSSRSSGRSSGGRNRRKSRELKNLKKDETAS